MVKKLLLSKSIVAVSLFLWIGVNSLYSIDRSKRRWSSEHTQKKGLIDQEIKNSKGFRRAQLLYEKALGLEVNEELGESMQVAREALDLLPKDADILSLINRLNWKMGFKTEFDKKKDRINKMSEEDKFNTLNMEIRGASKREKAYFLSELARMYRNISDYDEAKGYVNRAYAEDPSSEEVQILKGEIESYTDKRPSVAESFRQKNKRRALSVNLDIGVEQDSNVVLEEVNPSSPTDKDDGGMSLGLSLAKTWSPKVFKMKQQSSYNFYQLDYFQHEELDIASHTLDHSVTYSKKKGKDSLNILTRVAYNHFENAGSRLLWSGEIGSNVFYYHQKSNLLWNGSLTLKKTSYYSDALEGQEGDNYRFGFGASRVLNRSKGETISLNFSQMLEAVKDDTFKYDETALILSYRVKLKRLFFDSIYPSLKYAVRNYDAAQVGQDTRKDQKTTLKLKLSKRFQKYHTIAVGGEWLENDSNITSSLYKKNRYSLTYSGAF